MGYHTTRGGRAMTVRHRFEHEDDEDMAVLGSEPLQPGHPEPDPIRAQIIDCRNNLEFVDHLQNDYWIIQAANDSNQMLGCDITTDIER